ncbi:MAG: ATP-binding protein, partial [Propionicimonas sp.]|nr:ATP-binding protein [Propionicimonas sp.]
TASMASLVGGGARMAVPGAVSRAHRGVLFLDEVAEFNPRALDALRVPLESGRIVLGRALATTSYPASFQLVMAANPCPCGLHGTAGAQCRCTPSEIRRYGQKVSGPILDRVDIHQHLAPMRKAFLAAALRTAESSQVVAGRVRAARERQRARLTGFGWRTNGEVPGPVLRRALPLPEGAELLDEAVGQGRLSARGVDKVLRLAWTLADLDGVGRPTRRHLTLALALRRGEQRGPGGGRGRA